jgi:hypothetical protein
MQIQQLGRLVDDVKRRQPRDEIVYRENLPCKQRRATIGFVQALKQPATRTTVRQNHRNIMQGDVAVCEEFVDNMVQEWGHWLLAIGCWLLAINYNNNYDFKLNCGF